MQHSYSGVPLDTVSLSALDRLRYAPTKQQHENFSGISRGTYTSRVVFSIFSITSARWDRITKRNKIDAENLAAGEP